MGYAGGTSLKPTYHEIGDHAEAVQIDYDPSQITYADLLELFWAARRPTRPAWKRQYMSAIFFADESQLLQAEETYRRVSESVGAEVFVEILPASSFYRAEDYHQKYYLQRHDELMAELRAPYPEFRDFVDSTAAARLNGYLGGARTQGLTEGDLEPLGLSPSARRIVLKSRR